MKKNATIKFFRGQVPNSLERKWDALYLLDDEAHYFLSRSFIQPILLREADACLLTVWHEEQLVGLLPIHVDTLWDKARHAFRSEFKMAGSLDWADYNGILIDARHEIIALNAISDFFKNHYWGYVRLKHLRMSDQRRDHLLGGFASADYSVKWSDRKINDGQTNNLLCPAINLPDDFDSYLNQLSKNTRQKLRRFIRKLDAGEFKIRSGSFDDLPAFENMWAKQWPNKSNVEIRARKYAEILATGIEQDTLGMSILTGSDGAILGMIASFRDAARKEIKFFVSARVTNSSPIPVGLILHAAAIRSAISSGYKEYDFLRGDEPYKLSLGGQIREIFYPIIRRRSGVSTQRILSPLSAHALIQRLPKLIKTKDYERAEIAATQLAMISKR